MTDHSVVTGADLLLDTDISVHCVRQVLGVHLGAGVTIRSRNEQGAIAYISKVLIRVVVAAWQIQQKSRFFTPWWLLVAITTIINHHGDALQIERWPLLTINHLGPHDALKHHFTSLKTDLIFLQQRVLERNFYETNVPVHGNFL